MSPWLWTGGAGGGTAGLLLLGSPCGRLKECPPRTKPVHQELAAVAQLLLGVPGLATYPGYDLAVAVAAAEIWWCEFWVDLAQQHNFCVVWSVTMGLTCQPWLSCVERWHNFCLCLASYPAGNVEVAVELTLGLPGLSWLGSDRVMTSVCFGWTSWVWLSWSARGRDIIGVPVLCWPGQY